MEVAKQLKAIEEALGIPIHPGPDMNNLRAFWALEAVVRFVALCPVGGDVVNDVADLEDASADLICDIFHLMDFKELDYEEVLDRALCLYRAEKEEAE